uniref:Activin_recp domain-containing protein n=1 Tax=Parastrongyloides trichosuri TaxID=131310 RepID=A0A0N5A0F7_PARTI
MKQLIKYRSFSLYSNNILSRKNVPIFISLLLLLSNLKIGEGIKCYCTDESCSPYGACEANLCLVGITKNTNSVIRTCANDVRMPLGCRQQVDGKWTDLCACDQHFCNTFSYLRTQSRRDAGNSESFQDISSKVKQDISTDDTLIFQRVDTPDYDFPGLPNPNAPLSTKTSLLTLLLVVVPLSVGAAAVIVVAFNYYCHLC